METAKEVAVITHHISKAKMGGESIKTESGEAKAVVDILSYDGSFRSYADRDREGDPLYLTERDRGVIQPSCDRSAQRFIDQD